MATQRSRQPPDERSEDGPVCPVQVGSMEPRTRRNPDAAVATFAVRSRRHAAPLVDQQWRRREVGWSCWWPSPLLPEFRQCAVT